MPEETTLQEVGSRLNGVEASLKQINETLKEVTAAVTESSQVNKQLLALLSKADENTEHAAPTGEPTAQPAANAGNPPRSTRTLAAASCR